MIKIICDIVFQKGRILFAGFALCIFMVYVMNKNLFQDVLLVRYLQLLDFGETTIYGIFHNF